MWGGLMNAQEPGQPSRLASQETEQARPDRPPRLHSVDQREALATGKVCLNCGQDFGEDVACQFCQQIAGLPNGISLASPARRLGGYLMDGLLFVVTLGIGYLVWWVIALCRAQTPGKQVLGMTVLRLETMEHAGWGLMVLREVVAKGVIGVLSALTLGIVNVGRQTPGAVGQARRHNRRLRRQSPARLTYLPRLSVLWCIDGDTAE